MQIQRDDERRIKRTNPIANCFFEYLRDMMYDPEHARMDLSKLPEDFHELARGLEYYTLCVRQVNELAGSLAKGKLDVELPPQANEMAAPLKALHATLKHLTWQTQQVAKGDYHQRVEFMGEFAKAFNTMVTQLDDQREALHRQIETGQRKAEALECVAYNDELTNLYNRHYGMNELNKWLEDGSGFVICFVDMDNLKYVNDQFGHIKGDEYILHTAATLRKFSSTAVVCRLGGDEFMLLAKGWGLERAQDRMEELRTELSRNEDDGECGPCHSMSYGVVEVDGSNIFSASELLTIADDKMYEYKRMHKKHRKS